MECKALRYGCDQMQTACGSLHLAYYLTVKYMAEKPFTLIFNKDFLKE